jgi:ubiquinone/menaquinone biosynthesis C-methylase UbiE
MVSRDRYDGLADWYDEHNTTTADQSRAELLELFGTGEGPCLDLGCGTGHYFDIIRETGRTVVGLDRSADQLHVARRRSGTLVQADGGALPFRDATFPTVAALWVSSDVDDFPAVLSEVARVLKPGGLMLFHGVHPCFNGPFAEYLDDGSVTVHPQYRLAGWHEASPWWGHNIRHRVGMRHVPLADLLNAFVAAGLSIDRVTEPGNRPVPFALAIRARRQA